MRKVLLLVCSFIVAVSVLATDLQYLNGKILPVPREVSGEPIRFLVAPDSVNINLYGEAKDADIGKMAKEMLLSTVNEAYKADSTYSSSSMLDIIGGLVEEETIQGYLGDEIPEIPVQGYLIRKVSKNLNDCQLVVTASDLRGLYYGFATLRQMLSYEDGVLYMNYTDVFDYPTWLYRYASDDITVGSREKQLELANLKISAFAWQYRVDWRVWGTTPEHQNWLQMIKEISDTGLLDYMFMIHLYGTDRSEKFFSIADEKDIQSLIEKCKLAAASGINMIMICADDHTPRVGFDYAFYNEEEAEMFDSSVGKGHGYLMSRLHDGLKDEYPELRLAMVGAPYAVSHGIGEEGIDRYVRDWGEAAPKDVYWVWTGPEVLSANIEKKDAMAYEQLLSGQPMFVWDNSNCIDAPMPRWETTFYDEMDEDSDSIIYWNGRAMVNSQAFGEPYLHGASAYAWNPENYDAEQVYIDLLVKYFGEDNVEAILSARQAIFAAQSAVLLGERDGFETLHNEAMAAYNDLKSRVDVKGNPLPVYAMDFDLKAIYEFYTIPVTSIEIYSLENEIVIDGVINEDEWRGATEYTLVPRDGSTEDKCPTTIKVGYTKRGLYIAVDIINPSKLPDLPEMPHDSFVFFHEDHFEIFLQPSIYGNYAHLCFDYEGNRFDERGVDGTVSWDGDWSLATTQHENGWRAEVFIPVIELELFQPKQLVPGNKWSVNFFRVSNEFGVQAFSRGGDSFHEPQFFGELLFR